MSDSKYVMSSILFNEFFGSASKLRQVDSASEVAHRAIGGAQCSLPLASSGSTGDAVTEWLCFRKAGQPVQESLM